MHDDRALCGPVEMPLALEGDGAREDAAVDLGKGDVHREVARREPALTRPPIFLVAAGEHELKHRAIGAIEGCRLAPGTRARHREPGRIEDDVGCRGGEKLRDQGRRERILEARHKKRKRIEPARRECGDEPVDRKQIGRLHERAVEDESRDGCFRQPMLGHVLERGLRPPRPIEAGMEKRGRLVPRLVKTDELSRVGEKVARVLGPALERVAPQATAGRGLERREARELGIRLVVARKQGERYPALAREGREPLDAIGPISDATQKANDDEPRVPYHALDIEIDREIVGELLEIGEAEHRDGALEPSVGGGEGRKLRIRGGEQHKLARALPEVDRLGAVENAAGCRREKMHQAPSRIRARPLTPTLSP